MVHLTYGGKTEDVPARYRGTGRGNLTPNLWSAKWTVPADAPTGVVGVSVTAKDKSGRIGGMEAVPERRQPPDDRQRVSGTQSQGSRARQDLDADRAVA